MTTERINAWVRSVGAKAAASRTGVSETTLARYCIGSTDPKGAALITITAAVEAWEASKEEASQ